MLHWRNGREKTINARHIAADTALHCTCFAAELAAALPAPEPESYGSAGAYVPAVQTSAGGWNTAGRQAGDAVSDDLGAGS